MLRLQPGDKDSRQLGGVLLKELARSAPEAFVKHASQVGETAQVVVTAGVNPQLQGPW